MLRNVFQQHSLTALPGRNIYFGDYTMPRIKPEKFLLPGLFLLILGLGNIAVGEYRSQQYDGVVMDLSVLEATAEASFISPLKRIQQSKETPDRLYQRQKSARAKRDLYEIVIFGGQIILGMSIVLLVPGALIKIQQRRSFLKAGIVDADLLAPKGKIGAEEAKENVEFELSRHRSYP